jgi:hypothetical protein
MLGEPSRTLAREYPDRLREEPLGTDRFGREYWSALEFVPLI